MSDIKVIENLSARIAILEKRPKERLALVSALRHLGFNKFSPAKSFLELKEAFAEGGHIDWVVITVADSNEAATYSEIDKIYRENLGEGLRVSVVFESIKMTSIANAFAMGVLSAHRTDWNSEQLKWEFRAFLRNIMSLDFDETRVAAHYLRAILKNQKRFPELLHLENCLDHDFHDNKMNLLEKAEAFFLLGEFKEATKALDRAVYFDRQSEKKAKDLEVHHLRDGQADFTITFAEKNDIESVLVVDSDQENQTVVREILMRMGVQSVYQETSSRVAWEKMSRDFKVDLVIMGWHFDGDLAGDRFIQRIRSGQHGKAPIVVMSEQFDDNEKQLLLDMNVSQILLKPCSPKQALTGIAWAISQGVRPTEIKTIERRLLLKLNNKEYMEAFALMRLLQKVSSMPHGRLCFLEGAFEYRGGRFKEAEEKLLEALKLAGMGNLDIAHLLARTSYKLGKVSESQQIYLQLMKRSPRNIRFVCEHADMVMEDDLEKAELILEQAARLDANNPLVLTSQVKLAMLRGLSDRAAVLLPRLRDPAEAFAFLNSLAAKEIKNEEYESAIVFYQKALSFLVDTKSDLYPMLNYNLGLACLKANKLQLGMVYLERSVEFGRSKVFKKSKLLLAKARRAKKEGGRPLEFDGHSDSPEKRSEEVSSLGSRVGLRGIYQVADLMPRHTTENQRGQLKSK